MSYMQKNSILLNLQGGRYCRLFELSLSLIDYSLELLLPQHIIKAVFIIHDRDSLITLRVKYSGFIVILCF